MATKVAVPPIPLKSSMVDPSGMLNVAWARWFVQLYQRVGSQSALSNLDLETNQSTSIGSLQTNVTTLQGQVTTLQSTTSTQSSSLSDLSQGPVL